MSTKFSTMVRSKYSKVKYGPYKKKPKRPVRPVSPSTSDDDSVVPTNDKKKRTYEERLRRERLSQGYDCLRNAIHASGISNNECLLRASEIIDSLHERRAALNSRLLEQNRILESMRSPVNIASLGKDNAEDDEYITCTDDDEEEEEEEDDDDENTYVDVENVDSDSNGTEYSKHMNSVLIRGLSEMGMKHIVEESDSSDSE